MSDKLLRFSLACEEVIDKHEGGDRRLLADRFENVQGTIEHLAERVRMGRGFSVELRNGWRKAANFAKADLVAVDIDDGMTIEQALEHPLVREGAVLIYTTASHTPENPHFRIVFRLASTVTEPEILRAIMRSLALRLGGDLRATDAARLSYGNSKAQVWTFPERRLSDAMQEELIAQSKRVPMRGAAIRARPAIRSALRLNRDQLVTLATGQVIAFSKVKGKASLHCPFHHDRRPSAFVVTSAAGVRGIHCMSCRDSFWPNDGPDDDFDPLSFDAAVMRAHAEHGESVSQDGLTPLVGFDGRANVTIVEEGTGLGALRPGLTFVKAPKGAGKTEALRGLLRHVKSALLIMHRRSLSRQSCQRLRLPCYLDLDWLDREHIGVCFDSILRLPKDARYGLVIIDEVEQVLAHILGGTISSADRVVLFRRLVVLLRSARFVIAMDADIGWASFTTLTRLMTGAIPDPRQGDLFRERSSPVRVLMNVSKPGTGKTVEVYRSKNHLVAELIKQLTEGKRVFVAANSKAFAEKLNALIAEKLPSCRRLLITAVTAAGEQQQRFLESPAKEALNYDVIITSPAAGTGLDITFPNRAVMIDAVFGFCEADITTHWDFDQHICRVRQPGMVKVWISPERMYYETHADVIRRELLDGILRAHVIMSDDRGGSIPRIDDDPLVEMATMVLAQQRWSKNNIRKNFIAHKEAQGFTIAWVEAEDEAKAAGGDLLKIARELGQKEYARRLVEARPLSRIGYTRVSEAMEGGATVSQDLWYALERTKLEGFYREPVSADLIERDQRGNFRGRVALFEGLTQQLPQEPEAPPARSAAVIHDREQVIPFLRRLLEATPLIKSGAWDRTAIICGDDLDGFCRLIEQNRAVFETQLDVQVRRDLRAKPMSQLVQVLRMLGLGLVRVRTEKAGTGKLYFYGLDPDALQLVGEIARARSAVTARDFLQQLHGDLHDEDDDAEEFFRDGE